MPRLERGVLARRALAVVRVADGDPRDVSRLVVARYLRDRVELARFVMLDLQTRRLEVVASKLSLALFISPFSALTAVKKRLLEMLSRWAAILEPRTRRTEDTSHRRIRAFASAHLM